MRPAFAIAIALIACSITMSAQSADTGLTLRAHARAVLSIDWSPDGTRVATAGGERTARIWDAATGALLHALAGHTHVIQHVAWSPDGARVATASHDRTVILWDANTGSPIDTLVVRGYGLPRVEWSPDGEMLATAGADSKGIIWDAATGTIRHRLLHYQLVVRAEWSPNGLQLATVSSDTARIWDVASGNLLRILPGTRGSDILNAAWSPGGDFVATAARTPYPRIWNAGSGELVHELQGHTNPIADLDWSPDGARLVTASGDSTARIWDVETGREVKALRGHNAVVNDVEWSRDGRFIATASLDKTIRVWDAFSGEPLDTLSGHTQSVREVHWSPSGPRRLLTRGEDTTARIWNLEPVSSVSGNHSRALVERSTITSIHPNPMSTTGKIELWITSRGAVRLSVVDLLGREIATLFAGELEPGRHLHSIDIDRLVAGQYYLHLRTATDRSTVPLRITQ
jgi:WD40 repeat protein